MSGSRYANLDAVIKSEIDRLVRNRGNFTKRELLDAVKRDANIHAEFRRLRRHVDDLNLDDLIERGLMERISALLHKKDAYGIRRYESYRPDGAGQRSIWFEMRQVDAVRMRLLIQASRVRERSMALKRECYQLFADRLDQLAEGATLDQIYDDVAPLAARFVEQRRQRIAS